MKEEINIKMPTSWSTAQAEKKKIHIKCSVSLRIEVVQIELKKQMCDMQDEPLRSLRYISSNKMYISAVLVSCSSL